MAGLNHGVHDVIRPQYKRLVFDGEKLSIYGRGKLLAEFDAVSGKALDDGTFDYSVERQKMSDVGPIPEGEYKININATQRWHSLGFWQKTAAIFGRGEFPGGTISWGAERVDIIPNGANTYGRYGFTIHGRLVPGSAGYIDLTQYDRQFFNYIRNSGYIRLTVKY